MMGAAILPEFTSAAERERRLDAVLAYLLSHGRISEAQLERGRRAAEARGDRLDHVLNRLGLVMDADLLDAYQAATGIRPLASRPLPSIPALPQPLEPSFLRHAGILPLAVGDDHIELAISDPVDLRPVQALALRLNRTPILSLVLRSELEAALAGFTTSQDPAQAHSPVAGLDDDAITEDVERLKDLASEAPIVRLVAETIELAVQQKASDIHITRMAEGGRIRFRIDGQLTDIRLLAPRFHQAVISRLKIMAGLDIGERRLPQDGRIQTPVRGREIDLRISTMPHAHGEGAFIRILDKHGVDFDLDGLGFRPVLTERIKTILGHAHGLFLITGPTGSGKTTTLYSALKLLNHPDRHIVTVEDPIEYMLPGINQIQVNRRAGLDFSRSLRSVLRQDPDIIMVGEIRDRETAAIAVQAALTGHLVLATLHTNNALSAVDRLVDMGIEPFLLAGTLRGLMAQRLVRRACPACRGAARGSQLAQKAGKRLGNERSPTGSAAVCETCGNSGFSGRIPMAEVVITGSAFEEAIASGASNATLVELARKQGFETLSEEGKHLVASGLTSQTEVMRALGGD